MITINQKLHDLTKPSCLALYWPLLTACSGGSGIPVSRAQAQ